MENINNLENLLKQEESLKKSIINDAKKNVEAPPPEFRFTPTSQLEQKAIEETEADLDSIRNVLLKGWEAVVIALQDLNRHEELMEIITWFQTHLDTCIQTIQNSNLFTNEEEDKKATLEYKIQLPKNFKDTIYEAVVYHANNGKIDEAICALLICITFNPTIYELWVDYGTLLQEKQEDEAALYAYTIANGMDGDDAYLYMKMANAWASLGHWDKAKEFLEKGIEKSYNIESNEELIAYSKQLNQWIEEQSAA